MKCTLFVWTTLAMLTITPQESRAQEVGALPASTEIGRQWRKLGDNGFALIYLDTVRVSRADADRKDVWLYLELYSRSPSPNGWFDRTVDHVRVNCSTLTVEGLFSTTWYDGSIFIKSLGTGAMQAIPGTTPTRPMAEQVCKAIAAGTQ